MAFGKKTAIVSIAVLVMIVAVAHVEARTSEGDFGRSLLTSTQASSRDIQASEGRNLYNIVGSMAGKHCCNTLIHTCCAPAPAPTPARKLTSKASTPKASTPEMSKAPTPKTSASKTPKASAPKTSKSSKVSAPKMSTSKSPKATTPKTSASKTAKAPAPSPSVFSKIVPKGFASAPTFKKSP